MGVPYKYRHRAPSLQQNKALLNFYSVAFSGANDEEDEMKKSANKPVCPIDRKAAPFYGGGKASGEVARAGNHSDVKAASKHSRRR